MQSPSSFSSASLGLRGSETGSDSGSSLGRGGDSRSRLPSCLLTAFDEGLGSQIFIVGGFMTLNDLRNQSLVRWDGGQLSRVGDPDPGLGLPVFGPSGLNVRPEGQERVLYGFGGSIVVPGGDPQGTTLARFDGSAWGTHPDSPPHPGPVGRNCLVADGPDPDRGEPQGLRDF